MSKCKPLNITENIRLSTHFHHQIKYMAQTSEANKGQNGSQDEGMLSYKLQGKIYSTQFKSLHPKLTCAPIFFFSFFVGKA